ncbi:MAG: hypothetical protein AAFZ18_37730 [Myxococcota bacterium]
MKPKTSNSTHANARPEDRDPCAGAQARLAWLLLSSRSGGMGALPPSDLQRWFMSLEPEVLHGLAVEEVATLNGRPSLGYGGLDVLAYWIEAALADGRGSVVADLPFLEHPCADGRAGEDSPIYHRAQWVNTLIEWARRQRT